MSTLAEMLTDVYEDCGHPTVPDSRVVSRITKNINKAYRAILGDVSLSGIRNTLRESGFVSEVGVRFYGVAEQLTRVFGITERDNDRQLEPISLDYIRTHDPGMTSTGSPWAFVNLGYKPIRYPLSESGTGLWAASSSASDTTQTIELNAVRAGVGISGLASGDVVSTALTGVTRIQIGSITDIIEVQTIRLSAAAVGIVTIYDASSSGNVIAQIAMGKLYPNYLVIQLYPTPSAVITYYIDGEWKIVDMDDAGDIPIIPTEFHDVLTAYARMKEYEHQNDQRVAYAREEYTRRMGDLKYRANVQSGEVLAVGGRRYRGISRMGGMFPVDTY